jgi:FkbM family methyltransferase
MTAMSHPIDVLEFFSTEDVPLPEIRIVDVGAMDVGESEPWSRLVSGGTASLIGFEPNPSEYKKLNQANRANCRFLPHALGDGNPHTLHIGKEPMTSSLFPPDPDVMKRFHNLWELSETVGEENLETIRLDDVAEVRPAEFIKLDVQGTELMILEGGRETLVDTLAIQTEVCFLPIYKGQALFADIDINLRAHGFSFHTMVGVGSRPYRPLIKDGTTNRGFAQVIWSNALYFKDPEKFPALARTQPEALLKIAVLAHELYGAYDFAALALQHYGSAHKPGLATAYIRALMVADPAITAQK